MFDTLRTIIAEIRLVTSTPAQNEIAASITCATFEGGIVDTFADADQIDRLNAITDANHEERVNDLRSRFGLPSRGGAE